MEKTDVVAALAALAQDNRLDVFRLLVEAGPEGMPDAHAIQLKRPTRWWLSLRRGRSLASGSTRAGLAIPVSAGFRISRPAGLATRDVPFAASPNWTWRK